MFEKLDQLDQEAVDAFEEYIRHVRGAVEFVKIGSGKKHQGVFDILEPILEKHNEELFQKIKANWQAREEREKKEVKK